MYRHLGSDLQNHIAARIQAVGKNMVPRCTQGQTVEQPAPERRFKRSVMSPQAPCLSAIKRAGSQRELRGRKLGDAA